MQRDRMPTRSTMYVVMQPVYCRYRPPIDQAIFRTIGQAVAIAISAAMLSVARVQSRTAQDFTALFPNATRPYANTTSLCTGFCAPDLTITTPLGLPSFPIYLALTIATKRVVSSGCTSRLSRDLGRCLSTHNIFSLRVTK